MRSNSSGKATDAVGYRADGVYYLADEQTGQAGGAGRNVQRDR
jgi:hypothetical protein